MYNVPTFNLTCNIWRNAAFGGPPTYAAVPCNLAMGRRVRLPQVFLPPDPTDSFAPVMQLLLPARTDVQDSASAVDADIVEVPAGTGRYYVVNDVDDVGRGFANEYRLAGLLKMPPWPAPIP